MVVSNVSQNGGVGDDLSPDLTAVKLDPRRFDGDFMELAAKIWNAITDGLAGDEADSIEGRGNKGIVTGTWADDGNDGSRWISLRGGSRLTWDPIDGYVMDGLFTAGSNCTGDLELIAEIDRGGVVLQLVRIPEAPASDDCREEIDYGQWLLKPNEPDDVFDRKIDEAVDVIRVFIR